MARTPSDFSDEEFLQAFHDAGENRSAMARELGVSEKAIRNRLKKIDATTHRTCGKTVVVVHDKPSLVPRPPVETIQAECVYRPSDMERIDSFLAHLDRSVAIVDAQFAEMEAAGTKRIKPWVIELLLKVIREGRGLVDSRQKIRKDFYDEIGTKAFMDAVIKVLVRKDESLAREFFLELAQLGFGSAAYDLAACYLPKPL